MKNCANQQKAPATDGSPIPDVYHVAVKAYGKALKDDPELFLVIWMVLYQLYHPPDCIGDSNNFNNQVRAPKLPCREPAYDKFSGLSAESGKAILA
jgi:hypothetical protein